LIDAFNTIGSFGWNNIVLIFLLFLVFSVAFLQSIKFICEYFGLETKHTLQEKKRDDDIKKLKEDVLALQCSANQFKDDRIHDREQSFEIQDHWSELINTITDKQNTIIERVEALAEQSRKYQLADIRETLLQAYRYYTSDATNPLKMWSEMESNAFWEQFDNYKEHGGNGYMESEVKPAMTKLKVVYLDDYETISELMASRVRHKN
jgi:hypothetical protein